MRAACRGTWEIDVLVSTELEPSFPWKVQVSSLECVPFSLLQITAVFTVSSRCIPGNRVYNRNTISVAGRLIDTPILCPSDIGYVLLEAELAFLGECVMFSTRRAFHYLPVSFSVATKYTHTYTQQLH